MATSVSNERLAAAALPISCWQVAIASQESGALALSAYLVVTTLCASMPLVQLRWAMKALPSQNWALGASELSDESGESPGGFLVFAGLEIVQCRFVIATFARRVGGARSICPGICPFFAVDRNRPAALRFQFAQTGIEIEIKILLALLGSFQLIGQRFDLAAQAGDIFRLAL